MRCGEDSHKTFADVKRDRDFGKSGGLAGHVIFVFAHIGCVTHLAGRSDIADHAFLADLQTMAFVVHAASVHAREYHLTTFLVMQIYACLDAAERVSYVIHDVVDELIEVEDRGDLLRGFLQALQILDLIIAQGTDRNGGCRDLSGNRSHVELSPPSSRWAK